MEDLYNSYPDDDEVAAMLISIKCPAASGGDLDNRMAVKAGTIALDIQRKPTHPGPRYTIHITVIQFMRHSLLRLLIAIRYCDFSCETHADSHIVRTGCGTLYPEITNRPLTPPGAWRRSGHGRCHSLGGWGQYGDLQKGD